MDVTALTQVLEPSARATTVVIDVTAAEENAPDEVRLRWEDLRKQLASDGAPEQDLAAIEQVVTAPTGVGGAVSRYVSARGGQVLLEEVLVQGTPDGVGSGTVSPIADLVPLLRYEQQHVPVVVARVDRVGVDAEVVSAAGGRAEASASTRGTTLHIRKVKVGGWADLRYKNTVENGWEANAGQAATEVARLARESAAAAVVVTGDVRARQLLVEHLDLKLPVIQVEGDRRAEGASQLPVEEAVAQTLRERAARLESEAVERWRAVHDDPDTQDRATADLMSTVNAIRSGQVEELLLVPGALRGRKLVIGPAGTDVAVPGTPHLWDGPTESAPADLALLRAAALTGAQVQIVDREPEVLPDGVGARLRWSGEQPPGTA